MQIIITLSLLFISLPIIAAHSELVKASVVVVVDAMIGAVIVVIIEQQIMIGLVITGVIIEMTPV